jgi:hypothetical protein
MEQNSNMNPHEISITVKAQHLPEQSDPDNRQFAFAYTVTIRNTGKASIQLIARRWLANNPYCVPGSNLSTPAGLLYPRRPELCEESTFALPRKRSFSRHQFLNLPW